MGDRVGLTSVVGLKIASAIRCFAFGSRTLWSENALPWDLRGSHYVCVVVKADVAKLRG
jgi:hypothetical protein